MVDDLLNNYFLGRWFEKLFCDWQNALAFLGLLRASSLRSVANLKNSLRL